MRWRRVWAAGVGVLLVGATPRVGLAHSGPPYPIVSNAVSGPYRVSVWTDPDATDDGTPGGQFWVIVGTSRSGDALPRATAVHVAARPLDRSGLPQSAPADPEPGDPSRYFVALLMDHEGRFAVDVAIDGPLGDATVRAEVDATYDLRPPPFTLIVYLMPFALVGGLWVKVLMQRRKHRTGSSASGRS